MDIPKSWKHKSGYRLDADGKSIEYTHENNALLAIVESRINETEREESFMEFYTVIFDISGDKPWPTIESHEFFREKENAKANLREKMVKHQ